MPTPGRRLPAAGPQHVCHGELRTRRGVGCRLQAGEAADRRRHRAAGDELPALMAECLPIDQRRRRPGTGGRGRRLLPGGGRIDPVEGPNHRRAQRQEHNREEGHHHQYREGSRPAARRDPPLHLSRQSPHTPAEQDQQRCHHHTHHRRDQPAGGELRRPHRECLVTHPGCEEQARQQRDARKDQSRDRPPTRRLRSGGSVHKDSHRRRGAGPHSVADRRQESARDALPQRAQRQQ